jgi:hypothetical protein
MHYIPSGHEFVNGHEGGFMKASGVMTSKVIGDEGISVTPGGFRLDVRLPWYRSLPVSTVEIDAVSLDGTPVHPANMTFQLEGRSIPLSAMRDQVDTVWYVLDSAYLNVKCNRLDPGVTHEVSITMSLYPPYIRGLRRMTKDRRILPAA